MQAVFYIYSSEAEWEKAARDQIVGYGSGVMILIVENTMVSVFRSP
jgi:hypothetical protein